MDLDTGRHTMFPTLLAVAGLISAALAWLTLEQSAWFFLLALVGIPLLGGGAAGWMRLGSPQCALLVAVAILPYVLWFGAKSDPGDMGSGWSWFASAIYAFLMAAFASISALVGRSIREVRAA